MNIYTFGDGYATGHIWPEWPQILQALMPDYQVVNTAAVGAGPEWLAHKFVEKIPELPGNIVIFQWPKANRFDKLIEDQHWQDVVSSDPVYNFNQHDGWWLSSASTNPKVRQYHKEFVQLQQHLIRRNTYKVLVRNTLENLKCTYIFTSTDEQETYAQLPEFKTVRLGEVQPSPYVHFRWILDTMHILNIDQLRAARLGELISQHKWEPFYSDRELVWQTILAKLNDSNT